MPKSKQIKYITISVLLLVLSFGLIRSTFDVYRGSKRVEDLENEVLDLEKRKKELESSIEYKQTNEYVEEKARNDLNLIKPGESVFVVSGPGNEGYLDDTVLSKMDTRVEMGSKIRNSNWYKWFKLFF
jgi:cell division protein DivIC